MNKIKRYFYKKYINIINTGTKYEVVKNVAN